MCSFVFFLVSFMFFFFKQKTAYEMRISDWSSDVCSSDLIPLFDAKNARETRRQLKEIVMAYAKVVARHPDFERMVGPLADQQILRLLDSALRMLLNAGVDIERAGASWSVLQSLAQTHAASNRRLSSAKIGRASCRERVSQSV